MKNTIWTFHGPEKCTSDLKKLDGTDIAKTGKIPTNSNLITHL